MLRIKHVCTDCGHQPICTLQGDFMKQLETTIQNQGEDYFIIDVTCKHFMPTRTVRPSELAAKETLEKQFNIK